MIFGARPTNTQPVVGIVPQDLRKNGRGFTFPKPNLRLFPRGGVIASSEATAAGDRRVRCCRDFRHPSGQRELPGEGAGSLSGIGAAGRSRAEAHPQRRRVRLHRLPPPQEEPLEGSLGTAKALGRDRGGVDQREPRWSRGDRLAPVGCRLRRRDRGRERRAEDSPAPRPPVRRVHLAIPAGHLGRGSRVQPPSTDRQVARLREVGEAAEQDVPALRGEDRGGRASVRGEDRLRRSVLRAHAPASRTRADRSTTSTADAGRRSLATT